MTLPTSAASSVIAWISRRPKSLILMASALTLAGLGVVDAISGPDVSVLTFYFLPVLVSTWFVGRSAGVIMSTGGAAEWIAADLLANPGHMPPAVTVWNAAMHFAFFVFAVWSVSELKGSLQREERAARQRIEREIETAREVQLALLPKVPETSVRGFDVSASCEPARGIGGDIYDFVPLGEDRLLFGIGDVSGKGIAAALLGASLLAGLRSLAPLYRDHIDRLMSELNRLLFNETAVVRFATLFIAQYEFATSQLRWVNAGHTAPLLFRDAIPVPERLTSNGTVVGMFADSKWEQGQTRLERGDVLILFSDGLSETYDAEEKEFGEERIIRAAAEVISEPAARIRSALIDEVTRFSGGGALGDDRTVVVLRRTSA